MSPLVVEAGLAGALPARPPALVVAERARRRRGHGPAAVTADAALAAILAAGEGAVVLARRAAADPGAAALPALGRALGREVVVLPDDRGAAAWVVAVAAAAWSEAAGDEAARWLQALAGAGPSAGRGTRAPWAGADAAGPPLRAVTIARWARCAWRPCGRCGGGGLPGARCGRCAGAVPEAPR